MQHDISGWGFEQGEPLQKTLPKQLQSVCVFVWMRETACDLVVILPNVIEWPTVTQAALQIGNAGNGYKKGWLESEREAVMGMMTTVVDEQVTHAANPG